MVVSGAVAVSTAIAGWFDGTAIHNITVNKLVENILLENLRMRS
jgi:hypothetical protein